MNLHITGHHVQVTPALREYFTDKMVRINKHFDHVIDVHVIISVNKLQQKIEATIHVKGRDIFCESVDENMYAAIDALVDKLDRAILKHKEKTLGHRHDTVILQAPEVE
ncbi:MAG: ribosome-associated translation inhibitor RaiA [Betaproteobacteria bacterium]|jgi:putative sigma-54 modulation protein